MIKTKQVFFWTSTLKGHGFHGDKATIFYLTLEYYSLSVLSSKLYFLEIGPVHQKLSPLNSNFFNWEDTLNCPESGVDYFLFIGNDTVEE